MSSNQIKSSCNFDDTTTITVRPTISYGASNKGRNIDKSQSDPQQNTYNKNRIPTPYPSNVPRPKASHGNRTASVVPSIRNQPQDIPKDFGKNKASYPLKSCGFQCQNDLNPDIILKKSFMASLKLPPRSKDKIKEALSDTPYKRREMAPPARMDLYHAGETLISDKMNLSDQSMEDIDCWKYDDEYDFDDEVGISQLKRVQNSEELNGVKITCPEDAKSKSRFLDKDIKISDERRKAVETKSEKMKQITFERKYGMQYKSFALPRLSRNQNTHISVQSTTARDTEKLINFDDYQNKLDSLDTWQKELEEFSDNSSSTLKGKTSDETNCNAENLDVDTLLKTLGLDNQDEDENDADDDDEALQMDTITDSDCDKRVDMPLEDATLTENLMSYPNEEIDDRMGDKVLKNKQNIWTNIKQFLTRIGNCKQVPDTMSTSSQTDLFSDDRELKGSIINNFRRLMKVKK